MAEPTMPHTVEMTKSNQVDVPPVAGPDMAGDGADANPLPHGQNGLVDRVTDGLHHTDRLVPGHDGIPGDPHSSSIRSMSV
jgi:hypothetical protein